MLNGLTKYYEKKHPINKKTKDATYKINESHLIKGIFDYLLHYIINGKLTDIKLDNFCELYIKIIRNKPDRTFPRTSKTPFTKWYVKGYSNLNKYMKIINYLNKKIQKLNKNLKTIAKRVISIDGKKCNG